MATAFAIVISFFCVVGLSVKTLYTVNSMYVDNLPFILKYELMEKDKLTEKNHGDVKHSVGNVVNNITMYDVR